MPWLLGLKRISYKWLCQGQQNIDSKSTFGTFSHSGIENKTEIISCVLNNNNIKLNKMANSNHKYCLKIL